MTVSLQLIDSISDIAALDLVDTLQSVRNIPFAVKKYWSCPQATG